MYLVILASVRLRKDIMSILPTLLTIIWPACLIGLNFDCWLNKGRPNYSLEANFT